MTPPPLSDDVRKAAHDVNNLLTAIIGAADAALERREIDPETRADLMHIREGAHRGAALIRRLRAGTVSKPGVISINETIRATSRLLAHRLRPNINLALDLNEGAGHVEAEPSQLDRLLLNLTANARHAMPDGGTVTLITERRVTTVPEERVPDVIPPGDFVVITFTDTGVGIPRDQLARIFDPGFSAWRRPGGSGLGLSSVRDIVRETSGFLAVESVEGHGTRFDIYLPRQDSQTTSKPTAAPRPTAKERSVLLVEDDLHVRQVAERVLRRAGWNVRCADSAETALETLKDWACDLMISDVAMPGMDGVALARHVQSRWPELPIILTSGYERTVTDDGYGSTKFAFLMKPYDHDDLLAAVTRVADERETEAAP